MIPVVTKMYEKLNMKPLYLGCASSSANTCMEHKLQYSKWKCHFSFVALLQALRSSRRTSGVH
jgi:hypothetical protein